MYEADFSPLEEWIEQPYRPEETFSIKIILEGKEYKTYYTRKTPHVAQVQVQLPAPLPFLTEEKNDAFISDVGAHLPDRFTLGSSQELRIAAIVVNCPTESLTDDIQVLIQLCANLSFLFVLVTQDRHWGNSLIYLALTLEDEETTFH